VPQRGLRAKQRGRGAYQREEGPPLFFLTGRAKSGTSWLARMLNFHPEVLCKGEGRFIGREYVLGNTGTRSLYGALIHSEEVRGWLTNSAWTRDEDTEEQLAEFAAAITKRALGRRLAEAGKNIVGDKTPLTSTDVVPELVQLFPGAKLIHIVRDGRDVAVSAMHHVWNQDEKEDGFHDATPEQREKRDAYRADPEAFVKSGQSIFNEGWLEGTARNWADLTRPAMDDGPRLLGEDYAEVRYEDFLENPEELLQRMFKFLGADSRPAVVQKCVERASFERMSKGRKPGEEDSRAFVRKGIAGDWKNVFTDEDKRIFKETAGDLLIRLGHERDLDW
jgi:hypothetical protein